MTNKNRTVLYTGITNDLKTRVYEHKMRLSPGFTKRYKTNKLVYYEIFDDVTLAVLREKQIKYGSRKENMNLIDNFNKEWRDLYNEL